MRRVVILGTGLLAVGAAFCAGRASAPKLKLKYPWAGELLNRPCGKTELEWRCATGGIRKDGDIPLTKAFVLRTLTAEIKPKGIVVRADVTVTFVARKKGFDAEGTEAYTGKVRVVDIGVPADVVARLSHKNNG